MGPTLKLDITSPGQKSVEGTTTAVKQLAAALRDLPKASAELLKLQQALAGGAAAPSGLKAGAGEMKELVGEIKNLGAQLNTSFLSLEETIKKGWGRAAKAQAEGEAKVKSASIAGKGRTVTSVGSLGQPIEVPLGYFAKMQAGSAKIAEEEAKAAAKRLAQMQVGALKIAEAAAVEKAAQAARLQEMSAGLAKFVAKRAEQAAAEAAADSKWQAKMQLGALKIAEAAAAEKAAQAARLQEMSAGLAKFVAKRREMAEAEAAAVLAHAAKLDAAQKVLDAKYLAMSPRAQARTVLNARSRLDQGIGAEAVGGSYGSMALAAAQGITFAQAQAAVHTQVGASGNKAAEAAPKFRLLSASMSDAHSAARGLASGFGAMFLTWGRIMPLLAGAAISHSFVQSLKVGADVRQDLETVRILSQESATAVAGLEKQLVALGTNGPFGPREVAEAMRVLSLAGLSATQVTSTIKPALDLAVVGQTTIEKSASAIVAVGTAYGYQAEQFGLVSDAMSKAAAISMSSVDGMMESFRTSSVVGQQYKVSLNDTATALALLANVGIRNSAAGTSIRQMYSELSGASSNTRRAMKELGVEVIDTATGGMKPLLTIVKDLNAALSPKDAKAYQRAIQDMSNERGAKSLVALLEAFASKAKEAGSTVETELERISQAIKGAPGFAAISAAQLSATPQNQMKAVASSFQTALFEAFKAIEPTIMVITARMKEAFGSDQFVGTVSSLASAVGNLSVFLIEQIDLLKYLALGYAVWKGASVGMAAVNLLVGTGTALFYQNAVASGVAAAAAGTASTAARTAWLSFLGPVGIAVGALTALWSIYQITSAQASAGELDAARVRNDIVIKSLTDEASRLDDVNNKLRVKLGLEAIASGKPAASDDLGQLEDEYTRLQKREKFLLASPAVGNVRESNLAELARVRSDMEKIGREMYDYGRRIAEGTVAVSQKSAENAALVVAQNKVFGTEGIDNSREEAARAKREAAEQAAIDQRFAAVRREYQLRQQFITGSQSQEDQLIEAWHAAKYTTVTQYEKQKVDAAEKLHTLELENLKKFVDNSKALIAAMGNTPKARTAVAELATEAERAERDIAFRTELARARAARKHQEMLKPLGLATLPDLPKTPDPIRVGGVWQQQLDDWKGVKEQLIKDRDEFMTGWIDRGRTMWADWLTNGKLTFRSLGELFQQTLADITYKRFIAAPLAKAGESVFDSLLKPVSEVRPGTGEASTDLRRAFEGLSTITKDVGNGLLGLGNDFWQLFVQVGNGLASMFASGGSSGIGSFVSSLFSASSGGGGGGEYIDVLGLNANGNAFRNGLYAFANGGLPSNSVISSPHFFRFGAGGSNLGVAGEAGEEAIMPLSRGPRGDLGVRVHGGSGGGQQVVAKTSVVIENHGGAEPKVSRETQPDGSELIRVVLNATAKDINRGGAVRKSMQSVSSKKNMPRY